MLMLALRLFLKNKGGKQHRLIPFVGSNQGVETFLKMIEHKKRICIEVSRKFYAKPVCFFCYKGNSESFIFFPYLIIEFL